MSNTIAVEFVIVAEAEVTKASDTNSTTTEKE